MATFGLIAAFAFGGASAAYAFTETKVPPPAGQSAPVEAPNLQLDKADEGVGLSLTTPGEDTSGETELTIPGVGSIGKLPKLDFGLELLYGGGSTEGVEGPGEDKNDDVLIKGKIRHRF
jgi:hypothetical protein